MIIHADHILYFIKELIVFLPFPVTRFGSMKLASILITIAGTVVLAAENILPGYPDVDKVGTYLTE
jgi:hypothetical protein